MFTPSELLVCLHNVHPERDGVPLKALTAAVDMALRSPDIFPQQVISQAIGLMEREVTLPLLFMRTVIIALRAAPKVRAFVLELLARLISRQVGSCPSPSSCGNDCC